MTRRQLRRTFRVNAADNLVVRIVGKPPLELLSDAKCPECGVFLGPHGKRTGTCKFFEGLTLDQLAQKGYARYVEQV